MIGVNIHIDTSEVSKWVKESPTELKMAKRDLLAGLGRDFEHAVQDESVPITVTSGLHNSISSGMAGDSKVWVTGINYAEIAMETGRAPGKTPPINELKRWARLKLGDERLAFVVARKIGEQGTKLYRTKRPKRIMRAFQKVIRTDLSKRIVYFLNAVTK